MGNLFRRAGKLIRMLRLAVPALVLAIALTRPPCVFGNGPEQRAVIFLDRTVSLDFVPESAFLVVDVPDYKISKVPAVIVPPYRNPKESGEPLKVLLGARIELPPQTRTLTYTIILESAENRFAFVPPRIWDVREKSNFSGAVEELKAHLDQRKTVLKSFEIQDKLQSDSLRRLRADADTIADIGRIVEVKEESDRLKSELATTERIIENLKQYVVFAKTRPMPKNSVQMELDLTRQLAELNTQVQQAEHGEGQRQSKSESDLQRNLSIIEATRFDNPQELKKELSRLQQKRLRLEQGAPKEPERGQGEPNYWDVE